MAWNRKARLYIGKTAHKRGADAVMNEVAVDVSELDFEFEVKQQIAFEDGSAEITIFNLSETSRNSILVGQTVILDVGYEDEGTGVLFVGEVRKVRHAHSSTDWITKISAESGRPVLNRLEKTSIGMSYTSGTRMTQVLQDMSAGLGIMFQGGKLTDGIVLKNGWYHAGRYQTMINRLRTELAANKLGMYVDFNQLVVYKAGEPGEYAIVNLTLESGLLNAKVLHTAAEMAAMLNAEKRKVAVQPSDLRERIAFTSILLPQIRPNGLVKIKGESVNGLYIVEKLKYKGDNYGKVWNIEGEATRRASKQP